MKLHILLTDNVRKTMPKTTEVVRDYGMLTVIFDEGKTKAFGIHCIIEDTKENIIEWLKPFDGVILGNGNPMMESFKVYHVKNNEQHFVDNFSN